jgi:predicted component of type VI protein secretion system
MRYSTPLALVTLLTIIAACSSNKAEDNPRPERSVQQTLDSAANRVARDTADTTAQRDTSTSR